MKKISFTLPNGEKAEGYALTSKGVLWAHFEGETFAVETSTRKRRGGKGAANANPGHVVSPMPGKIIKMLVKEGDAVGSGSVLLVMEAMKMEYTLKAQADGKVEALKCAVGDQVVLGQLLAKLSI